MFYIHQNLAMDTNTVPPEFNTASQLRKAFLIISQQQACRGIHCPQNGKYRQPLIADFTIVKS